MPPSSPFVVPSSVAIATGFPLTYNFVASEGGFINGLITSVHGVFDIGGGAIVQPRMLWPTIPAATSTGDPPTVSFGAPTVITVPLCAQVTKLALVTTAGMSFPPLPK
jgi:hypothetical protein